MISRLILNCSHWWEFVCTECCYMYDIIKVTCQHCNHSAMQRFVLFFFNFIGSGFSVHITLKESNLAPLYQAVDHADSNDNAGFHGDITIRQQYCPFPVPEKYQLSLILHQVCFYRAIHASNQIVLQIVR